MEMKMNELIQYIPWFFTVLSLIGAYLNSRGNLWVSSWVWLVANSYWLTLDASRGLYAQSALYSAFIAMNCLGLYTSFKSRKNEV